MREIKFRAWDKENKKMIYQDPLLAFHRFMTWVDSHVYEEGKLMPYIMLQYTGIKDKNGNPIYEGDIMEYKGHKCIECGQHVKYPNHNPYTVFWTEHEVGFVCENDDNYMSPRIWGKDMEVIGNIYEHPELLAQTTYNPI